MSGEFEKKKESGKIYMRHESKDKLKFDKIEDYTALLAQRANECEDVKVSIYRRCKGVYSLYWKGLFSIFDSEIDYDKCYLEVKPKPDDEYTCLGDALKNDYTVFDSGSSVTATSISTLSGNYETFSCQDSFTGQESQPGVEIAPPVSTCLVDPDNWCILSNEFTANCYEDPDNPQLTVCDYEQLTTWHREIAIVDCVNGVATRPPYGSGWNLTSQDCAGTSTSTWWRCPGSLFGTLNGPYTRGRLFSDVLNHLVSEFGCNLTVKSDFFNINPENDAPDNSAYNYAAANFHHITFHQKSDIKRNGTNGSSAIAWELKAEDLFDDLLKLFNVWYKIDNGKLVLEHYSFFTSAVGRDLSGIKMPLKVNCTGNENVRSEKFFSSDESTSEIFKDILIMYECGEEDKEQRLRLFNLDISYVEDDINKENVSDEGFVLICNDFYEGEYVIIDGNSPLAFRNILPALHIWARLYKSGKINDIQTVFESWIPYIKQDKFKIDDCCSDPLDTEERVSTKLGLGTINTAAGNIFTGKLELELSY